MSSSCIPLIRIGLMIESVSLYAEAETKPAGSSAFCILVVPGLPPFFNVNLWRENLQATAAVPQQVWMWCATGAAVGQ